MQCPKCGALCDPDARFCRDCGAPLYDPRMDYRNWYGYSPYGYLCDATPKFRSFLVWNIIAAILCSFPIGLLGVFLSSQARNAWRAGLVELAYRKAQSAELAFWVSAAVGVVVGAVQTVKMWRELWNALEAYLLA